MGCGVVMFVCHSVKTVSAIMYHTTIVYSCVLSLYNNIILSLVPRSGLGMHEAKLYFRWQ